MCACVFTIVVWRQKYISNMRLGKHHWADPQGQRSHCHSCDIGGRGIKLHLGIFRGDIVRRWGVPLSPIRGGTLHTKLVLNIA